MSTNMANKDHQLRRQTVPRAPSCNTESSFVETVKPRRVCGPIRQRTVGPVVHRSCITERSPLFERRAVCRRPAEQRITQQLSYDKISRADYRRPRGQTAVRGVVKLLAVTTPERRRHNASLRLPPRPPAVDSHARHAVMVPGGTVGHFVIAARPATPHESSVDER